MGYRRDSDSESSHSSVCGSFYSEKPWSSDSEFSDEGGPDNSYAFDLSLKEGLASGFALPGAGGSDAADIGERGFKQEHHHCASSPSSVDLDSMPSPLKAKVDTDTGRGDRVAVSHPTAPLYPRGSCSGTQDPQVPRRSHAVGHYIASTTLTLIAWGPTIMLAQGLLETAPWQDITNISQVTFNQWELYVATFLALCFSVVATKRLWNQSPDYRSVQPSLCR